MNGIAEAHENALEGLELDKKRAIRNYRLQGMKKKDAIARYEEDLRLAKEKKAEEERIAAENAAKAAAEAEEKAMANTRLLEEIRDLLAKK